MNKTLILVICFMAIGCAGKNCIRIDGEYDGYKGGLEYCHESEKNTATGKIFLVGPDGKDNLLLSDKDAEKIMGLLGEATAKTDEAACVRLAKRLKE